MKNYITSEGFQRLQAEFHQLVQLERPRLVETVEWAASNGDRSENADYIYGKRRLREIDRRLRFLTQRIESAVVVNLSEVPTDRIVFGCLVGLEDDEGQKTSFRLVGEDESEPEKGFISWKSPVATALLGKRVHDEVTVRLPKGDRFFTIVSIGR